MHSPKISVIIPVFNSENTIGRCIDSVLQQNFPDFEVILIDDGSIDSSSRICDEYARIDTRIRVFHKPNGGVSSARNMGLDNACGEWVTFIDSDDWLSPNFMKNIGKYMDVTDGLIIGGHRNIFADGQEKRTRGPHTIVSSETFDKEYHNLSLHGRTSPWGKLFRRKLIDGLNLRFDERLKIGEDAVFLFSFIMHLDSFRVVPTCDYYYNFETEGSLTKKIYNIAEELYTQKRINNIHSQLRSRFQIKSEQTKKCMSWIEGYYIGRVINALYNTDTLVRKQRIGILKQQNIKCYIENLQASRLKEKILFGLLNVRAFFLFDLIRIINQKLRHMKFIKV